MKIAVASEDGVTGTERGPAEAQTIANKPDSGTNQGLLPIESPLRRPGIDPTKLKPFDEVVRLCKEAGFTLKEVCPDLLPYQEFRVFERC